MKKLFCLMALAVPVLVGVSSSASGQVVFSEFFGNPPGADPGTQNIELAGGTPGAAFIFDIVSIESDVGGSAGTVDRFFDDVMGCLLYTSPSPRDATLSRMPSSA